MRLAVLLVCVLLIGGLKGQDQLYPLTSNPLLFPKGKLALAKEKSTAIERDSFFYQFDTISLPFIDDFSRNHLPTFDAQPSDPGVVDTIFYRLLANTNGTPLAADIRFENSTTFRFEVNDSGRVTAQTALPSQLILLNDYSKYPTEITLVDAWPPYNIYDTINKTPDTVYLAEPGYTQDSIVRYLVPSNPNDLWTNRSVYYNNTYPIDPPSIGVVTFDGLNDVGFPYDFTSPTTSGPADELTSVPINLSGKTLADSIFLSFYFQAQGLLFTPTGAADSLVLEFYDAMNDSWSAQWGSRGIGRDEFEQVILQVDSVFLQNGFRFRFRNKANQSGRFDAWHLDYIILNEGRSQADTTYNDVAISYESPSMLESYTSMPYWHYMVSGATSMNDSVTLTVRNNRPLEANVFPRYGTNDLNGTPYFRFPSAGNVFYQHPADTTIRLSYPLNAAPVSFEYPTAIFDTARTLETFYNADTRQIGGDFIPSNDTIFHQQVFDDYYAYDDGSAEAGYGINGLNSFIAVKFDMPIADTLSGIQMFFLPQAYDISRQDFEIRVWNVGGDGNPGSEIYRKTIQDNPQYSEENAFVTYFLDTLISVTQSFFVGYQSIGERSLNVGYDFNTNSRNQIFYSLDGNSWSNPNPGVPDGSLMIRALLRRDGFEVGLNEIEEAKVEIKLYPNPARDRVQWKGVPLNSELQIYDMNGRLVQSTNQTDGISVATWPNGMYFFRWLSAQGALLHTEKLMVNH